MFAFDFLSYVERKNPFAAIAAFRALVAERPFIDAVLLIKTQNAHRKPAMERRLREAIEPMRARVLLVDETLSDREMKSLIALTDCFISLHRSEGWGFSLCEAMSLGKPVIATAYSGNMDYCNESTAKMIPFDLVAVRPDDYPHWENQHWAEPDIEAATQAMRELVDDPEAGRALGRRARANLSLNFGYLASGLRYEERLNALQAARTGNDPSVETRCANLAERDGTPAVTEASPGEGATRSPPVIAAF